MQPRRTGWCVIRGNSDIYQPVPEGSEFGATWTTNRRRYRKAGSRGDSKLGQSAPPKDVKVEATRRSITGKAGGEGRGATQVQHRGRCRRRREPLGKPRTLLKPAPPKAAKFGATRADQRRHSRRTGAKGQPEGSDAGSAERERGTGQPGNANRAGWEDAGSGVTRNLIGRQNGTMHDPMSYKIIRKAPEAARSLALSILGVDLDQSVADCRI